MNERRELGEAFADLEDRVDGLERRTRAQPNAAGPGGWLFLGIILGAGIVGCCWLLSLRAVRELPRPEIAVPAIECNCGAVPPEDDPLLGRVP